MTSTGLYANQTCTNKSVFKRNFSKNIYVSKLASVILLLALFFLQECTQNKEEKTSPESLTLTCLGLQR